jgi:hypothetical protein
MGKRAQNEKSNQGRLPGILSESALHTLESLMIVVRIASQRLARFPVNAKEVRRFSINFRSYRLYGGGRSLVRTTLQVEFPANRHFELPALLP